MERSDQVEEDNPRHQTTVDIIGDGIGANRAIKKGTEAIIKIEETNEIKEADSNDEEILLIGFMIRDTLEKACKRVADEKAKYQLDLVGRCSYCARDIFER